MLVFFLKRKFPESICARPVGLNRCPAKAGSFCRLARRKPTDLYYHAAGVRVSCSRPRPLRLSRGQARAPCTPRGPTRAAVFFIVLFRGPSPVFFWLFRVRPLAFFVSIRLAGSFGWVSLCFVSVVRWAVGRGFFVSLTGRFGSGGLGWSGGWSALCPFFCRFWGFSKRR